MSFSASSQLLELFVVLCALEKLRYCAVKIADASSLARSKAGPVRAESIPSSRFALFLTPLHAFAYFSVSILYIFALSNAQFRQPEWMAGVALPEEVFGVQVGGMVKNAVRVLVCVASVALERPMGDAFEHLGDQFHAIGRRQKPRVVQTGPYAWVRHPIYAIMLMQEVLYALMFWSYVPLFALAVSAVILAVKVPIEEAAIERDDGIKEEYEAYKHKVPAKLVPQVW